jgi:hypothetical protein
LIDLEQLVGKKKFDEFHTNKKQVNEKVFDLTVEKSSKFENESENGLEYLDKENKVNGSELIEMMNMME